MNGVCRHCGGEVDDAGMALGGEAEEPASGETMLPEEVDGETEQQREVERMRAFGDALERRQR